MTFNTITRKLRLRQREWVEDMFLQQHRIHLRAVGWYLRADNEM